MRFVVRSATVGHGLLLRLGLVGDDLKGLLRLHEGGVHEREPLSELAQFGAFLAQATARDSDPSFVF